MDFGFTEEQEKLRKEVHDFYLNELPEDHVGHITPLNKELRSFWMAMQKKAGAKGYLTPGWGKESGGLGLSSIDQGIVDEEFGYTGARWPNFSGLRIAGPAVHMFGTDEQKRKFLPPIAKGEIIWKFVCQDLISSIPTIHNKNIYFGSCDHNFYCITENGELVWKFQTGGVIPGRQAAIIRDMIFFGSWDCNLYAVNLQTGKLKWKFPTSLSTPSKVHLDEPEEQDSFGVIWKPHELEEKKEVEEEFKGDYDIEFKSDYTSSLSTNYLGIEKDEGPFKRKKHHYR